MPSRNSDSASVNAAEDYPLPQHGFDDAECYVASLLSFITSSDLFRTLCGGVHILDFLTKSPNLYSTILPLDWRQWVECHDISDVLDLLMRESINDIESMRLTLCDGSHNQNGKAKSWRNGPMPPLSLLDYIQCIRKHALDRGFTGNEQKKDWNTASKVIPLPRHVAVGMKPKKLHEVYHFAKYISNLTANIDGSKCHKICHVVDFGSGQNYLGRALASPPYNKSVIALESKQINISGAKTMDVTAKLAEKDKFMRNKKEFRQGVPQKGDRLLVVDPIKDKNPARGLASSHDPNLQTLKIPDSSPDAVGRIRYVETHIQDGDLSLVIDQIETLPNGTVSNRASDPSLMVVSLHSCGNLLHHGLRSLIINPAVKAVALVGCCYNLVTERQGPPTYKLPSLRSANRRLDLTSSACDPHGFPMSQRLLSYPCHGDRGIRLNITARMMAVQAPENWTTTECESFFTRHFYRALLQRILLDLGIVGEPADAGAAETSPRGWSGAGPALTIGSLRKACYASFVVYVRGATAKLAEDPKRGSYIAGVMGNLADEDIRIYEDKYRAKKKELSIVWTLMAFSASVIEAAIVVDRWLYLKEQEEVESCWVETVFDYEQSPRNLVVVGIKK